jgi:hypothetical protein
MLSEADRAGNEALEAERTIWTPALEFGDALIFRPFTLHRTRPMDSGRERRSADIRLLPKTDLGPLAAHPVTDVRRGWFS